MSEYEENIASSELLQAQAHIWNQTHSYITSASLKCAVQLGIPDVIHSHGKSVTLTELTSALPIDQAKAHFLPHLMRVLVSSGFFVQEEVHTDNNEDIRYCLTPASRLLLKDQPFSGRKFIFFNLEQKVLETCQFLGDWFLNDDSTPFITADGMTRWKNVEKDLGQQSLFNKLMAEDSRLIAKVLMDEFKEVFQGLTSLTDVGGGTGTIAKAIAQTFPHLRCICFDLPHIVTNLKGTENLEFCRRRHV